MQHIAHSTVDRSIWVVYTHVYPFEYQTWVRPYDEWCDGRFREISSEEYENFLDRDAADFQASIAEAKAASKR